MNYGDSKVGDPCGAVWWRTPQYMTKIITKSKLTNKIECERIIFGVELSDRTEGKVIICPFMQTPRHHHHYRRRRSSLCN